MPQPSRWPNNGSRSRLINQGCRWSPRRRESRCLDKHAEKDHQKNGTKTKSDTSHTCQTWNRDNNKKREASFAVDTCHFSNLWSCTKETSSLEILIWKGSSTRQIQRLGTSCKESCQEIFGGIDRTAIGIGSSHHIWITASGDGWTQEKEKGISPTIEPFQWLGRLGRGQETETRSISGLWHELEHFSVQTTTQETSNKWFF